MINFAANISATNVTFLGTASNSGTITSNVTFKGTSQNTGTINGTATFLEESLNAGGTVSGAVVYDPPLLAFWILLKAQGDPGPWRARKIGTYRKYGGQTYQDYPQQICPYPDGGCYADPHTYPPLVPNVQYVLDYKNYPEYCEQPGNEAGCGSGSSESREFDPPLKASWVTVGRQRRLIIIGSRNTEALVAAFGNSQSIYGGPWQPCPENESCFAYPALYRPFATVNFVMDYEARPHFLNYPGNPES